MIGRSTISAQPLQHTSNIAVPIYDQHSRSSGAYSRCFYIYFLCEDMGIKTFGCSTPRIAEDVGTTVELGYGGLDHHGDPATASKTGYLGTFLLSVVTLYIIVVIQIE
ncbi:hypothetical protein SUGI_1137020 [Cryptomeria japonica]|nr:hypothetical protein SUGI_1137020 [Cryptomeria japonica]